MYSVSRRQLLISMACAQASLLPTLSILQPEQRWDYTATDWDSVMNDVIRDTNAALAGVSEHKPAYEVGSPHWCMERALDRLMV
jgi:hypothetical protein